MSYDFYFWKEQKGVKIDIKKLLQESADGVVFPGVVKLPLVEINDAFKKSFPDIEIGAGQLQWVGEESGFDVSFIHLDEKNITLGIVNCGYTLLKDEDVMLKLTDTIASLGCLLFDPQSPPPKPSFFKRLFG